MKTVKPMITLITGTRKGIGRFLAGHYTSKGHIVIGCSRKPIDWDLENYHHFVADVADEAAVKPIFKFINTEYGRLDNLINNAGVASMNHSLLTPLSTVHQILNTNFVGCFLFCREAAKIMKINHYGRIVNFSTVATPLKLEGEAIYAASKAALCSVSEILAREFASFGITVNSIGPTPIDTDLIRGVTPDKIERILARQAIPRLGTFEDIANVIDFFICAKSSFITGQNIYLGGV